MPEMLSAGRRRKRTRFSGKLSTERRPAVVQRGVPPASAAQPSLVTAQITWFDPVENKKKFLKLASEVELPNKKARVETSGCFCPPANPQCDAVILRNRKGN